jgi:hypothetical protein
MTDQERAWASWALRRWETFPVGREPRALVLTGAPARFERGFRSAEAKHAFQHGDIVSAEPLPDGLLDVIRWDPIRGSEPVPRPRTGPGRRRRRRPVLITKASPGRTEFATDRGPDTFPAWRLSGPDIGPLWVLDPAIAAGAWAPPEPGPPAPFGAGPHRARSAAVEADDLALHFTFIGGPPADIEYSSAEVIESDQAVVVVPAGHPVGKPGPRAAIGVNRTVVARLARALADRVLIDLDAAPVAVLPDRAG